MRYWTTASMVGLGAFFLSIFFYIIPKKDFSISFPNVYYSEIQPIISLTQLLSISPLLLTITDFVIPSKIRQLIDLGTPLFHRSLVNSAGNVSPSWILLSCFLPSNSTLVSTIKQRAARFLGTLAYDGIEAL